MKRIVISVIMLLVIFTCAQVAANWSDHFAAPVIIGPGTIEGNGVVLDTLTPELKYKGVGTFTYIYLFEVNGPQTLTEQITHKSNPIIVCRTHSSSLKIPSGILQPGHNYYWYVEAIHAPGTKSECAKESTKLYFSTANDAEK